MAANPPGIPALFEPLKQSITDLGERITAGAQGTGLIKTEMQKYIADIRLTLQPIRDKIAEINQLRQQINQLTQQMADLQTENNRITGENEQLRTQLQEQANQITDQINQLRAQLAQQIERVGQLQASVEFAPHLAELTELQREMQEIAGPPGNGPPGNGPEEEEDVFNQMENENLPPPPLPLNPIAPNFVPGQGIRRPGQGGRKSRRHKKKTLKKRRATKGGWVSKRKGKSRKSSFSSSQSYSRGKGRSKRAIAF